MYVGALLNIWNTRELTQYCSLRCSIPLSLLSLKPSHRPLLQTLIFLQARSSHSSIACIWALTQFLCVSHTWRGRKISGVIWKVKEESASIVIKAEMNDGFRGCGVDRLDDRGAEGPSPILKVFLAVRPSLPCQLTHYTDPDACIQGKLMGLYELYMGVNV